jgi:hypothetical protein
MLLPNLSFTTRSCACSGVRRTRRSAPALWSTPEGAAIDLVFSGRRSGVAGCFLSELHARVESEFGVGVGEVGLHGAR